MGKYFMVSVANVIGRDPETGAGLFYGTTNSSTAVSLSMTADEIRGGINNVIQGVYYHDKALSCTIEKPTFAKAFLPLNVGSNIQQGSNVKVVQTECIVLDNSGHGVVAKTPIGNVQVFADEDTVTSVASGSDRGFTVPAFAGKQITAIYDAYETVDMLTIETTTPPKVVDLTLLIQVRDENMKLAYIMQYNIPKFQVSGNYELSLSADGVSNESLEGMALNVQGETCSTGDMYATIKWVPVSSSAVAVNSIVIINGNINVTHGTEAQTVQLSVVGVRGGVLDDVSLTNSCSYAKSGVTGESTNITVNASTGLVTVAAAAAADEFAFIIATYVAGGVTFTDTVKVTVA